VKVFNAHDVLEFAIRVEENGEVFYGEAARIAGDQGARDIFRRLATEEAVHKKTFARVLASLGDYRPTETYDGEYIAYLQEYIDGKAIFKEHTGTAPADATAGSGKGLKDSDLSRVHDTLSAFDFAIQREVDSIVYYQELKVFVPEKYHKTVDAIVDEERKHFALLSEIKKTYL
jgi:rubrerythrin